jgi:hypothetical protein
LTTRAATSLLIATMTWAGMVSCVWATPESNGPAIPGCTNGDLRVSGNQKISSTPTNRQRALRLTVTNVGRSCRAVGLPKVSALVGSDERDLTVRNAAPDRVPLTSSGVHPVPLLLHPGDHGRLDIAWNTDPWGRECVTTTALRLRLPHVTTATSLATPDGRVCGPHVLATAIYHPDALHRRIGPGPLPTS